MSRSRFHLRMFFLAAGIVLFANGCTTMGSHRYPAQAVASDDRLHYLPGSFRYAIWNYHRPEFLNPDIDQAKAALLKDAEVRATALGIPFAAVKAKLEAPVDPKDPMKGTNLDATLAGFKKIYGGVNFAMIPAENDKIKHINEKVLPTLNQTRADKNEPAIPNIPTLADVSSYTPAQRRFRAMLLVVRGNGNQFFAELRANEPTFFIPGDGPDSGHPLFKETPSYIVTRDKDVLFGMGNDSVPPGEDRREPPYTDVIYTDPMLKVTGGPFMLAGKGQPANEEKPGMHTIVNQRHDSKGKLSKEAGQEYVRSTVRRLTINAIKEHAIPIDSDNNPNGPGTLDIAKYVSRQVPLGMVADFFGFYPPDIYTQIQWSRNTQNAFFHDPLDLEAFDENAIRSGVEMQNYISKFLIPTVEAQLASGRPPYDTMGMMLQGHDGLTFSKDQKDRIIAQTVGLVVGAGETTQIAVNRIMEVLLRPEYKAHLEKAVGLAKQLRFTNDPKKNEPLDHIVWEALRMYAMNPWVERWATDNHTITSQREDGKGAQDPIDIVENSKVFFSTQSAMFDTDRFENPFTFDDTRDLDKYIHMSANYHRCLGDDVALAMVPEMVKTMLYALPGLSKQTPDQQPTSPSGVPFPENYVLKYDSKRKVVQGPANWLESARARLFGTMRNKLSSVSSEIDLIKEYVQKTDDETRILGVVEREKTQLGVVEKIKSPPKRVELDKFAEREAALEEVYQAMVKDTDMMSNKTCGELRVDSYNSKQIQLCGAKSIKKRKEFAACYFLHRAGGQKTPQHAFNYCAYSKKLMDKDDVVKAANIFQGTGATNFHFLKRQL